MAAPSSLSILAAIVLLLLVCGGPITISAARLPPGASPLVTACTRVPFPKLCVRDLGHRLLDIQTVVASASADGHGAAAIAGAPGQVDFRSLVAVAMEAATEAGAVASTVFEGKLPGFNNSVPDFKRCLDNCTVTMASAMKKIHGATAAMKAGANDVAKTLAVRAIGDVSSCTISCRELTGDMEVILEHSLVQFQKMMRIAVAFITKMKNALPPPPESIP
uniref:Pectinesterase inhibitor domain-containing protein n=1 Tax=Leersia perrieri TaxID=77586 RepID=A0A0D9W0Z2_9ORYZ